MSEKWEDDSRQIPYGVKLLFVYYCVYLYILEELWLVSDLEWPLNLNLDI